jgi:hypothetical protein
MAFHAPESARVHVAPEWTTNNGMYQLPSPEPGWSLCLICSDGLDDDAIGELAFWEHVSVHARTPGHVPKLRTPTWKEMNWIKSICWDDDDVVVQFHPRKSDYVNNHPHVLHLWRWTKGEFPTPPKSAV